MRSEAFRGENRADDTHNYQGFFPFIRILSHISTFCVSPREISILIYRSPMVSKQNDCVDCSQENTVEPDVTYVIFLILLSLIIPTGVWNG